MTTAIAEEFERPRPRLFGPAYRLLGSAHEAEDAVQDAYLRFGGADRAGIRQPAAWLAKVVIRLCLDRLTSARARRETCVGTWLPEPVLTSDGTLGPLETAERREAVSTAMLFLLERLTPTERVVYVLREAFAYGHRETAEALDLTEANCRQLCRRAVARVGEPGTRFRPAPERQERLVRSFLAAARDGDPAGLEKALAEDVVRWSDGGGQVGAALRPIEGRAKVARFLPGALSKFAGGWDVGVAEVNGASALVARVGGEVVGVLSVEARDGCVTQVHVTVNPDKLDFVRRQLGQF
ncbi:RNA polymerase sigma factor SigJ [Streptomyces sp. NPDC056568]|uniref:RNA polymerase sigma factor SigJ n=1 Tax=Streptomyces sp. NPDC056568 TaxID=3345866 RepID=UPI003699B99C